MFYTQSVVRSPLSIFYTDCPYFLVAMKTLLTVWNIENSTLLLYKWLGVSLSFTEKRSASPSPSLPPISREQALLESFFHALSQFAFDKAKDQVVSYNFNVYLVLLTTLSWQGCQKLKWLSPEIIIHMYAVHHNVAQGFSPEAHLLKSWKLFRSAKPFSVYLLQKGEKCMRLELLAWRELLFI